MTTTPGATTGVDTAARRAALRARLTEHDLDSLLVTDLINVRYMTGFTGSNAALLVAASEDADEAGTVFCTDGRYLTQAAAEVPDLNQHIDRPVDVALLRRATGRIGFEAAHVSVAGFENWPKDDRDLVATQNLVEGLRAVKDPAEIDLLRRACAVADQALAELLAAGGIRAGRSEREVALDLDQRMRLLGASDPSFETIVAAGAHSAIPHHSPTSATLAHGDLVKLDFGATVGGYHSDMTRTFVLGRPADWQRDLYDLVARSQRAGCAAMVTGAAARDVDRAAREVIADAGQAENFTHGLGHGVGLEIHEAPTVGESGTATIEQDMCVTVEPGVYLPGRGGVRIEDSGVVHGPDRARPGYEVFTLTSKDLVEL